MPSEQEPTAPKRPAPGPETLTAGYAGATRSDYRSYLLRLWRDGPRQPWRAELQSATTQQIYRFADAEDLFAFLSSQVVPDEDGAI